MAGPSETASDVCVIGGGIIGLTIALGAADAGLSVRLLERGQPGRKASWAGAGMLPPAAPACSRDFSEMIRASHDLWPDLSAMLHERTGLDNGFRRCGGFELASDEATRTAEMAAWAERGVAARPLDADELAARCPAITADAGRWYELPEHWQVRNPRHLRALEVACRAAGVDIVSHSPVRSVRDRQRHVDIATEAATLSAGVAVVAAGAWSETLLHPLRPGEPNRDAVYPVRGQIALLQTDVRLPGIVQHGTRYLVPRLDGRVLVGATVEEVGFDERTTVEAQAELLADAVRLVPALARAEPIRQWAGLRPQRLAGPLIGPVRPRVYAACGHFRDGLCLSPLTGQLIVDAILAS